MARSMIINCFCSLKNLPFIQNFNLQFFKVEINLNIPFILDMCTAEKKNDHSSFSTYIKKIAARLY